jgi:hypothetical protein
VTLFALERGVQHGSGVGIGISLRITGRLFVLGFPFGRTGSWPFAVRTAAPVPGESLGLLGPAARIPPRLPYPARPVRVTGREAHPARLLRLNS